MFHSRVLVGACALGNYKMRVPPIMSTGQLYDSTGDEKGQIFVCYHDNQCYPVYIISYH